MSESIRKYGLQYIPNKEIHNTPNVSAERIPKKYFALDNNRFTDTITDKIIKLETNFGSTFFSY